MVFETMLSQNVAFTKTAKLSRQRNSPEQRRKQLSFFPFSLPWERILVFFMDKMHFMMHHGNHHEFKDKTRP
jgi:hypothetical protein